MTFYSSRFSDADDSVASNILTEYKLSYEIATRSLAFSKDAEWCRELSDTLATRPRLN